MNLINTDVCVIGAGAGGLSVAAGAVQMGASVVLIENRQMGGDCLNYGCVPSKSLIAAARAAAAVRTAEQFGVTAKELHIDFKQVHQHVHNVIANIAPHDSPERFTQLGVQIIRAPAEFIDKKTVQAGDCIIKAKYFVVATGSMPNIPAIPGLTDTPYLTNETIFALTDAPQHLLVVGGGPIGCEIAHAYCLLGVPVTLLEVREILPKDDPELVVILKQKLIQDGLKLEENIVINKIYKDINGINISMKKNGGEQIINGSHLLIATGRRPNIEALNLIAAGVDHTKTGITVNARLRTTNKRIYAIGDAISGYQFTHVANYHAGIVLRNILFKLPARVDYRAVPWVTYTGPELAQVGLNEQQASKSGEKIQILRWPFVENDRAQTSGETTGLIKVIVNRKGTVLGVSILGKEAGELLLPWCVAIRERRRINMLTNVIAPYPTLSEISRQVAGSFYTPLLFSNKIKRLVRWLLRF